MASWLDGVVGGIAKGVDSAKEGSRVFVEKAKLNTQIQDIEKEKNQLMMNMGNLVYNLQAKKEIYIAQCAGICENIEQLDRKIEGLREQLRTLEASRN